MATRATKSILLVSDDLDRSARISNMLARWFHVQAVNLKDFSPDRSLGALFVVVDANLADPDVIVEIKQRISERLTGTKKIFVINDERKTDFYQANSLGAADFIRKNHIESDTAKQAVTTRRLISEVLWEHVPDETKAALTTIASLNDNLAGAIVSNCPLPKTQIQNCCDMVISNLEDHSFTSWLDAVREHHSYTYRHSMIVSGLAVFFALQLGMRRADVERLAIGAILHDVGKMRMPLGLLDKPGPLSDAERAEINKHPVFGAEILNKDGQFHAEVVDITLHHHEYLDGSGYPDGLQGAEISDPVRIVTIVDIFAALIDERTYSAAMTNDRAYELMLGMDGKLDPDILRAFRPVALESNLPSENVLAHAASL